LIATPRMHEPRTTIALAVSFALMWRFLLIFALTCLAALNTSVTTAEALRLSGFIATGCVAGALAGWFFLRRFPRTPLESSRYVPRFGLTRANFAPSTAALSRWPILQAFAWSRPENTRFLLAAALLSIPAGAGTVGAVCGLALWFLLFYLVALLRAVPYVAWLAAEWLRSTPIGFAAFAWPIAERALLHQLCGTLIVTAVLVVMGAPFATAPYGASVWLTVVMLTTALALVDCYRGRSPAAKLTLVIATRC
jgi:hypothetical protein